MLRKLQVWNWGRSGIQPTHQHLNKQLLLSQHTNLRPARKSEVGGKFISANSEIFNEQVFIFWISLTNRFKSKLRKLNYKIWNLCEAMNLLEENWEDACQFWWTKVGHVQKANCCNLRGENMWRKILVQAICLPKRDDKQSIKKRV